MAHFSRSVKTASGLRIFFEWRPVAETACRQPPENLSGNVFGKPALSSPSVCIKQIITDNPPEVIWEGTGEMSLLAHRVEERAQPDGNSNENTNSERGIPFNFGRKGDAGEMSSI